MAPLQTRRPFLRLIADFETVDALCLELPKLTSIDLSRMPLIGAQPERQYKGLAQLHVLKMNDCRG